MDAHRSETWFFVALLAVVIFLSWLIFAPYAGTLVLAGALAFLFRPLYERLLRILRRESLAALAIVALVALIIFLPLGFFALRIFEDATALYSSLASHGGFDFGAALGNFLKSHFSSLHIPDIAFNVGDYAKQGLTWLIQNFGSLFSGVAQTFFMAFLSLFGLFYFLKDGARLKKWILDTVPLSPKYTEEIIHDIEAVGSSVIRGTLLIAVIDGVVMGLGFFIFHIPDPTFWGALTVPVSIIPILGTWLVAVPAIAYLFLGGQTFLGVCLLVWSAILINVIYNVLSPQLMHRGADIHPYVILLSILGGVVAFGPIGFLIGPLVIALLFSLLKTYASLVAKRETD